MNEAPVLPPPAERVVRVIKSNENKANSSQIEHVKLSDRVLKSRLDVEDIRATKLELESQITSAQEIQKVRGTLNRLKAGITGKTKKERIEIDRLERQVKEKDQEIKSKEKERDESRSKAKDTGKTFRHAEAVAEANRRNISADSGRRSGETPKKLSEAERVARKKQAAAEFQKLNPEGQDAIKKEKREVDWQERVVPIEVTNSGKEALERQSVVSDTLKFYDSEDVGGREFNKYQAEPKYLMPLPLINRLKQIVIDNKGYHSRQGDAKINSALIGITPLYEQIVRISEEKGVPMSENLIIAAFTEGLNITQEINDHNTWEFVKGKQGGSVTASDVGYYQTAAASMERFFSQRKNIVGEARLPYIIAYAAGELINNAPAHVVLDLRNLISEVIPVEHNSGEISPLGFGYSIDNNTFREMATSDPGVVDAFTRANKIASNIFETLREKRRFEMETKYSSGLGNGQPDFSRMTPTLRQTTK